MVSDRELASCVESLLRQGGPATVTSVDGVVRQLEAKLGMDLSHRASFIHDQIDILLGPHFPQLQAAFAAAAAAGRRHFAQIPTADSPFAHLPSHPHDHSSRFAAPLSPTTAAAATAPHQKHLNRHHYQPPPTAGPAPDPSRAPARAPKERKSYIVILILEFIEMDFPMCMAMQFIEVIRGIWCSAPAGTKRRGGPGGLRKICGVSTELQAIVGEPTMARTEIVKQLWAYIRRHNLQDPSNKRKIICNDELRLVFETDTTDMFKMNKLLAKHIIPLEPTKEPGQDAKRLKKCDGQVSVSLEAQTRQYPVVISDALAEFFCTRERDILQSEALRRVWDYIKAKQLEDPMTNMILLDAKLQQLFGCESLHTSGLSELLAHHLFKKS